MSKPHAKNTTRRTGAAKSPSSVKAAPLVVAHARIADRAYALWLRRGARHGADWQDWLQAEAELKSEIR